MPRPYRIDPQVARERAKKASAAAHSTDNMIQRLVDRAPTLTEEQRAKLSALLRPAGVSSE
jgi:hypothetical protein